MRAIYTAYLGWFDGNPTHLHPLSPGKRSEKTMALMGGAGNVRGAAESALREGELQWCLELCDLLLETDRGDREALLLKAEALTRLAEFETSANGRHYYLSYAKELRLTAAKK